MEHMYALGVSCIEFVQEWLPFDGYFELVNEISSPYHATETLVPLVSVFDSVFATQLILCLSFGGWLNAIMKWWILEDRPYWWVRETTYYTEAERPKLRQTRQTCETGPGCPSGHSATMALLCTLIIMSAAHVANDRKWHIPSSVQKLAYTLSAVALVSVVLARVYVSAHFPHQCVLGALVGMIVGPALCIYVCDSYIWCYGRGVDEAARWCHVAGALAAGVGAFATYWALIYFEQDPQFAVRLAFRWCQFPEHLHVSTTPVFALVQCTAYLFGWALAVTPAVTKYRHDTPNRSLVVSAVATAFTVWGYKELNELICKSNTLQYYVTKFVMFALKPMLYLRIIPALAMWPYSTDIIKRKID